MLFLDKPITSPNSPAILLNGTPLGRIRLNHTELNLEALSDEVQKKIKYDHSLPFYIRTLFPMFATTKIGNITNNKLLTNRPLTAYLIRYQ